MKFLVLFIILLLVELIYFKIADKLNIIDKPNLRSSHTHITLRGGGIIFLIGAWLWALIWGPSIYPWFLVGMTIISVISFIDDVHSVPNRYRIIVHFIAMMIMFLQWDIINGSDWPWVIVALIICTGIINAYNFMDGINGITAAYSIAVILPTLVLNHYHHFIENSFLIATLISLGIFAVFNFRKRARCFAGDVGSVGMAFIVIFALGMLVISQKDLSFIIFLALYGVDTILTIIHRLMLHENIFEAHRKHAFQLMSNELHIPQLIVSSFYGIVQLLISFGLIYLPVSRGIYAITVVIVLCICYILFMRKYYHLHEEYLQSKVK